MPGAYEIYAKEASLHAQIRALQQRSAFFLTNDELSDLDTYAKRIRGEVFFARAWLLCEGQSEFMLVSYFAELLATPLDRHGITVIDFQNNGSPGAFVKLATNLGIPWILLCDDDDAGKSYVRTIKQFGTCPKMI
jgi:putative ATP-dependent endonuclease of OLD family